MAQEVILSLENEEQTAQCATALSAHLRAGDVVLLDGQLAAGKTFFSRALVRALGSDETVTSPTYTIANIYETPKGQVLHVDAYRLKGATEFYHLGLEDELEHGIALIEWGSRLGDYFDAPLSIQIGFGETETARTLTITAGAPRWAPVLEALA
ncbi:tRNA (adenosine(37)-N6)-threonylcarbamoyltransferase complex ATPase subunit type 1 TsaE [Celeribacter litoreus]|uniref:tRNA (adenosine(37)-N6)-threonylcarbamoyltransferase complex ATPase subunit type 1 TsaE n=1 Tax=Celeribacter litoreus TaxID=2876714 RepID=UPI001CCFC2FF|nr:tRNA (adenosine(37)-N6)-threonylcarbamoyltransferase complex ATPase subunit type 1 TsaE [Celeribacter litoreus]MCA0042921.1 tRNA (adenosine(37)-N6)-threonylcarbamoyltransferase complex ATPase subunit type 1 TsaE [Celeribacter litoreus]